MMEQLSAPVENARALEPVDYEAELARAVLTLVQSDGEAIISLGFVGQEWRQQRACAGMNRDIFFPKRGESTQPAKDVCAGCEVSQECLDFAIENHEEWGVWGGKSRDERIKIRKLRKTA